MRVISIVNLKGGVGKTTTTVNMAAILARDYGKRVVVIDADPQANATQFFKANGEADGTADILNPGKRVPFPADIIQETDIPGVGIIPANMDLVYLDIAAVQNGETDLLRLADIMGELMVDYGVDYVLIDCPPNFSAATCAALIASDSVIVPVKPDGYVISGVKEIARQIAALRRVNNGIEDATALVTMYHTSDACTAVVDALRASGVSVFDTMIRRTDKVDESTIARVTLDTWSPYSSAGRDYRAFVREFLAEGDA